LSDNSGNKNRELSNSIDEQIYSLLLVIKKRRWKITVSALFFGMLIIVIMLLQPASYKAVATILPSSSQGADGGILGQIIDPGIFQTKQESLEPYYKDIILSTQILNDLINSKWVTDSSGLEVSLYNVFSIDYKSEGLSHPSSVHENNLKRLLRQKVIKLESDSRNGLMILSCTVPKSPILSASLTNGILDKLNVFCDTHSRNKAGEQRIFIENRLAEVNQELETITNSLAMFVEQNRMYIDSPALMRKFTELSREVDAQTAIWIELRRQLEVAKIDENKTLKSVDVLDRALPPTRKDGSPLIQYGAIGVFLGFFFSLIWFCRIDLRQPIK